MNKASIKSKIFTVIRLLSSFSLFVFNRLKISSIFFIKLFDIYLLQLSIVGNKCITYHLRPKLSNEIHYAQLFMSLENQFDDVCILFQGPVTDEKFLLNTCSLYRRNFGNVIIVISTWDDFEFRFFSDFANLKVHFLQNKKPSISGSHNINYQIVSTQKGLQLANKLGASFCLKTRCDQRFYSNYSLTILKRLINVYPISSGVNAKARIIEPGITVCKYRLWSMCDMFQFGTTSDLLKMWSVNLDNRTQTVEEYSSRRHTVFDIIDDNIAEIYIHREYAKSIGLKNDIDPIAYYNFIKSAVIVIDKELVDLCWLKYSSAEYGWMMNPLYSENQLLSRLTHTEWLLLLSGDRIVDFDLVRDKLNCYEN